MSNQNNIPVLTDLIEKGLQITLSDLGLDDNLEAETDDDNTDDIETGEVAPGLGAIDPFRDNPALAFAINRILEKYMELALQEIKLAILHDLNQP